jgi:hypothetical protein
LLEKLIQQNPKVFTLISLIKNASNSCNSHHKRQFLSLMRGAGFTLNEIKQFGFNCSNNSWKTAKNYIETFSAGSVVQENRGRKKISEVIKTNIKQFLTQERISRPAANRSVKYQLEIHPVRYLNVTIKEAYNIWVQECSKDFKKISLSKFQKIVKEFKIFKKAKKLSDMCEICEAGKKIERQLKNYPLKKLIDHKKKKLTHLYNVYLQHRKEAHFQYDQFTNMKDQLPENEVLLCRNFFTEC